MDTLKLEGSRDNLEALQKTVSEISDQYLMPNLECISDDAFSEIEAGIYDTVKELVLHLQRHYARTLG